MNKATLLSKIVKAIGTNEDAAEKVVLRSYSGRFMYGRECAAVNTSEPFQLISAMYSALAYIEDSDASLEDNTRMLSDIISTTRQDSMGLGSVLYWPDIEFSEDIFADFIDELATTVGEFMDEQQDLVKNFARGILFFNVADDVTVYLTKDTFGDVEDMFGELAARIQEKYDITMTCSKVDKDCFPEADGKQIIKLWPAD